MADFCNFCSKEMFGDVEPDINVYKEYESLQKEYWKQIGICEGCGLVAVLKDVDESMKVTYIDGYDENGNTKYTDWVDYTNRFHTMGN